MKSFLFIAVALVLLSAAAAAAILQPLQPEASPAATIINARTTDQTAAQYVHKAALTGGPQTAKKSSGCCLRCI